MHPKPDENKKPWTPPQITRTQFDNAPYAGLIEIVRSALKQSEKDASLNPNDHEAAELQSALERMLRELEPKADKNAA